MQQGGKLGCRRSAHGKVSIRAAEVRVDSSKPVPVEMKRNGGLQERVDQKRAEEAQHVAPPTARCAVCIRHGSSALLEPHTPVLAAESSRKDTRMSLLQ